MNKIKHTFKLLSVFLLTFLIATKVEAVSTSYIKNSGDSNLYNMYNNPFLYDMKKSSYGFFPATEQRAYVDIGIFIIKDSDRNVYDQVYCVQPGVGVGSSTTPVASLHNLNKTVEINYKGNPVAINENLRKDLSYVLTYGEALKPNASKDDMVKKMTKDQYYKTLATQAIIWELLSGERNTLKYYAPTKECLNDKTKCFQHGFYYNMVHGSKVNIIKKSDGTTANATIKNNKAFETIYKYYKEIIDGVRLTFKYDFSKKYLKPNKEEVPLIQMSWNNSTKKWQASYTSVDSIFKYYNVSVDSKYKDKVTITTTDNKLTITSTEPFSKTSPLLITLKTKATHSDYSDTAKGSYFYSSGTYQDYIKAGYTTFEIFGKLYTSNYQLKVIKKASTGEIIKGAKFNLCSDKACSKVIKELVTGDNGTVSYDAITKVGTYYLKETYVPKGYILDSTIKSINVTESNKAGSSSYATATITNNVKIFNLTKYTVDETGKMVILNDGCGTSTYTGPTFEIKDSKGNKINLTKNANGNYTYTSSKTSSTTTEINTCSGKFSVSKLPECDYVITETKAPEGLTLPATTSKKVNICTSDKNVSFVNGFSGLVFNKKNDDGSYISGGKFTLQKKEDNVYKDVLLKKTSDAYYEYVSNLTEKSSGATYILETGTDEASIGIFYVKKLPPGEYRVIEKEAPEGYEIIKDKDSTAKVTISDASKDDMYIVELVNSKSSKEGSKASAELIVAINTGRIVVNYILVIGGLALTLIIALIVRKKIKK